MSSFRSAVVTLGFAVSALAAPPLTPTPSKLAPSLVPPVVAAPKVYRVPQLTKESFRALPGDALIEEKGQTKTKNAWASEAAARNAEGVKRIQGLSVDPAVLASATAKLEQDERAQAAAHDAKVRTDVQAALRVPLTGIDAIRFEAIQLRSKFATASPAEKAQIQKRSAELLQKVKGGQP